LFEPFGKVSRAAPALGATAGRNRWGDLCNLLGRSQNTKVVVAGRKKRTSAASAAKVAAAGGKKQKKGAVVEHEESVHEANSTISNDEKQVGVAGPPWQILDA